MATKGDASSVADTARAGTRLPVEWAAELERAGGTFDSRLDRFLGRFYKEIAAARELKEKLDANDAPNGARESLRTHICEIHALLAGEGRHFVSALERREPALNLDAANAGANTLELAHGIERLESAVREEEAERSRNRARAAKDRTTHSLGPRETSFEAGHPLPLGADGRALPPGIAPSAASLALPNLHSDETLSLMQSDIHALKLELMRLQRAKTGGAPLPSDSPIGVSRSGTSPISTSTVSPDSSVGASGTLPPTMRKMSGLNVTRVAGKPASLAPSYVSHLEQMKSRLDALEKKPLSRAARRKSHARLGRTRTMGSLYDAPALSVTLDENANPNVGSMITPPRVVRKSGSPASASPASPIGSGSGTSRGSLQSTPSPAGIRKMGAHGSRLFIDGPEELLKRPQSHAATRDMQRYSLKVARRFGNESVPSTVAPAHVVEPRSKSAVAHSPRKRMSGLGLAPPDHPATLSSLAGNSPVQENTGRVVEEMEGDLLVRKGVLWKRWRRRYASMVSHQFFGRVLCLFSYDSTGGVNSARSQIIVLRDGLCRGIRMPVEVAGVQRYPFVLRTAAKEYYFAAESEEMRRKWVSQLRDAARIEASRFGSRLPTQPRTVFS